MSSERGRSAGGQARDATTSTSGTTRSRREPGAPLSPREREILDLLAGGISGAQIAERLVLSPETVRTHVRNAMAKLGASSRAQAVALAVQRREIAPPGSAGDQGEAPLTSPDRARTRRATPSSGESDATLKALLAGLVSLYDVDGGTIFLTEEGGLSLRRVAFLEDHDASEDPPLPDRVTLGEGALGRAALERRAQLLHAGSGRSARGRTTIATPMISSGTLVGVLCLTTRPSRLTGRGELLLLQAFGNRVGEVLLGGGDQAGRLKAALERFRTSWSAADGHV